MLENDVVYLKHMRDAIYRIENYVVDLLEDEFLSDTSQKEQAAVVRELEIIGEASKYLSVEIKGENKDIDWPRIYGMRNILIHEYMLVDYKLVWKVIVNELPKLLNFLEAKVGTK